MITKDEFNNLIDSILNEKKVEGTKIKSIKDMKNILKDKYFNELFFCGFKEEYIREYGDNNDMALTKVQDMIRRIDLLLNDCLFEMYEIDDLDLTKSLTKKIFRNDHSLFYDAVSFDKFDQEIVREFSFEIQDLLPSLKI